jgi:uncharacterized membrane protein
MDLYSLLKLVHVAAAVFWVGGASVLTLLVVILLNRGDDKATMTGVSYVALMGNRVFAPTGMLAIATGLGLAWLGGWFPQAWTLLAVGIVACTFVLGAAVLGPTCERAVKLWQDGDLPGAMALGRRTLRLVALDLGAQWAIISLMVLKPGWADASLAVPAALILVGVAASRWRGAPAATPVAPAAQEA